MLRTPVRVLAQLRLGHLVVANGSSRHGQRHGCTKAGRRGQGSGEAWQAVQAAASLVLAAAAAQQQQEQQQPQQAEGEAAAAGQGEAEGAEEAGEAGAMDPAVLRAAEEAGIDAAFLEALPAELRGCVAELCSQLCWRVA